MARTGGQFAFTAIAIGKAMSRGPDGNGNPPNNYAQPKDRYEPRDLLRFVYQTTAKGRGKGFADWQEEWKQCAKLSKHVQANSKEGNLPWDNHFNLVFTNH